MQQADDLKNNVVVDANLFVVMAGNDSRGLLVLERFADWIDSGVKIHAPELSRYEFANAVPRLIVAGILIQSDLDEALGKVDVLPVQYHHLSNPKRVIEISIMLGRQNAYDAAYLALAEELSCELWTLDGPLYRNAKGYGFAVNLIS
ncbi:MAG: type II toxin-antitoxin system VapC family toxin [Acidobacteriota bacterium]